uniref:Uncharacterized protein n=1 Tax=Panagrolaimus superbus TaxID=310955 RepID=A0A914XYC2_9BILA
MPHVGSSPDSPTKASLKSVSTLLETDSLPTSPGRPSTAPPPVPKLSSSSEELEKVLNEESAAAAEAALEAATSAESPPIIINTFGVQKDLEERRAREHSYSDSGTKVEDIIPDEWLSGEAQPDIFMFGGPGLIHFVSSTSGPSSLDQTGYGSYLDAITEEDSDDLRSQSSASSHHFGSSSAQSSVRAPSADVVGEVDARIINVLSTNNDNSSNSNSDSDFSPSLKVTKESKIVEIIDSPKSSSEVKFKEENDDDDDEEEEETPVLSRRESGPELLSEAEESLPESENLMFPRITAVAAAAEKELLKKKVNTGK